MSSKMETALRQVRGLGSAREGARHWWHERVSAIATLILSGWFVASILRLPAYDRGTITEWLGSPLAAVPMALLAISTFWHLKMGLIVVVEDYVHEEGSKLFWVTLINFLAILGAGLALFAIVKIATTGSAA
jgi:succinate dehydrogenase / fumarate reductase membrane anchor subunit